MYYLCVSVLLMFRLRYVTTNSGEKATCPLFNRESNQLCYPRVAKIVHAEAQLLSKVCAVPLTEIMQQFHQF